MSDSRSESDQAGTAMPTTLVDEIARARSAMQAHIETMAACRSASSLFDGVDSARPPTDAPTMAGAVDAAGITQISSSSLNEASRAGALAAAASPAMQPFVHSPASAPAPPARATPFRSNLAAQDATTTASVAVDEQNVLNGLRRQYAEQLRSAAAATGDTLGSFGSRVRAMESAQRQMGEQISQLVQSFELRLTRRRWP